MDNRQNQINANSNAQYYVRYNSNAGANPLCDKLRAQYGERFGAAINRSLVRDAELKREAQRNGWSRVRRPAPSYKVKSAIRSYEPSDPRDRDMKIYDPSAARAGKQLAMAEAGNGNGLNSPVGGSAQHRGVSEMSYNAGVQVPKRSVFSGISDSITGKNLGRKDEVEVKKNDFPIGIIFALVICALLFMLVIYCSMQKSMMENEVSGLEAQVEALADTESELTLELHVKDDLREIERYAIETIGMVKKENVQAKYVSTASEEKSVVINNTEDEAAGASSAILSIFGNILEYIN